MHIGIVDLLYVLTGFISVQDVLVSVKYSFVCTIARKSSLCVCMCVRTCLCNCTCACFHMCVSILRSATYHYGDYCYLCLLSVSFQKRYTGSPEKEIVFSSDGASDAGEDTATEKSIRVHTQQLTEQ